MNKKIILVSLMAASMLFGCDDPLPTEGVTLKLSVNYDKNTGMKYTQDDVYKTPAGTEVRSGDFKPVWKELQKRLDFTIDDVTIVGDKAVNQFKNNWDTDRYADLACGNVSDIVKSSVAGSNESLLDLSQYLEQMPNFAAFLEENPIVKLSITTSKHGDPSKSAIYYLPYFDGFNDLEKMTLVRADYVRKILDEDLQEVDKASKDWAEASYQPTVSDATYSVEVPKSLDSNETKTVTKAQVENIITQQNNATDKSGYALVRQLRDYVDARYGTQFAKRSDLFLGVDSCYDADEMVALMRVVRNSPELLTGDADIEMVPFVPREYNNQRIADLYRWAGQLWGVRGVESRSGYLYIDAQGKVQDARGDVAITEMVENLNDLYKEGLILQNFQAKEGYGTTNGKFAEAIIVGGNEKYSGFMEYDYSQTQGVWNDKPGSKKIAGYDFRPILGGVAKWNDGDDSTNYFHFTESWRSVKSQGWVLNAALAQDETKLAKALELADYFYSVEGHNLNSYGPESEGYTQGTIDYQGKEVPKFTQAALDQLNDSNIGGGSYTNYLRYYVGATLPVGYVKEQGMEYQCTSENSKNGLTIINKAIEVGTYKHVECAITENPFYTIVPSAFSLDDNQATQLAILEDNAKLGRINSQNSTSAYNMWDNYVMYGFGGTAQTGKLETAEEYLALINTTYKLTDVVKIYNDAYKIMIA